VRTSSDPLAGGGPLCSSDTSPPSNKKHANNSFKSVLTALVVSVTQSDSRPRCCFPPDLSNTIYLIIEIEVGV
jgi:hypothetical protein